MKQDIKNLEEKKLQQKADSNFELERKYQTNPIAAKIASFKKTKKEIKNKDLI